jgi:hypothetical protein
LKIDVVEADSAQAGSAVEEYESTARHLTVDSPVGPLELQLTPLFTE